MPIEHVATILLVAILIALTISFLLDKLRKMPYNDAIEITDPHSTVRVFEIEGDPKKLHLPSIGIPSVGDKHPYVSGHIATEINVFHLIHTTWRVTVRYAIKVPNETEIRNSDF